MEQFDFVRPKTLAEAVEALEGSEDGKLLAGGQSLIPLLKLEMASPTRLVSLRDIPELRGISTEGDDLVVGAAETHAEVHASHEVRGAIPALAELAGRIGDPQVRNRGTLGGSVAHADPAADYPAALLALRARIVTDRREIRAEDFFQGLFETALEDGELISRVRFARPERAAYRKHASPASKYAIAGVMVAKHADGVRVGVTGAATRPFRVDEMEKALDADFSPSALDGITVPADDLQSDTEADAEYRAHLVTVMARRAVEAASG